jgi:hypothetical protein
MSADRRPEEVSVLNWIVTLIVLAIPLVNLVMYLVWAFGGGTPRSKANYCRACIYLFLAGLVVAFLFMGLGGMQAAAPDFLRDLLHGR